MSDKVMNELRAKKPTLLVTVDLDVSTARSNIECPIEGYCLYVLNPTGSSVPVYVGFNEAESETFDITKISKIRIPFYRFFITNGIGAGTLILIISKTAEVDITK